MLVLDNSFASEEILDYLEESAHPVFNNEAAQGYGKTRNLNLQANPADGERIIATSELHFDQIKACASSEVKHGIEVCKDKAECRRLLSPLYPDYRFSQHSLSQLKEIDPQTVAYPVVIKPSTGFFSLGIYPAYNPDQWNQAMVSISTSSSSWEAKFNESVVNNSSFLVESLIEGDEYAIDAYFDEQGHAVVLDILKHQFANENDVSDRLYFTSKAVMEANLEPMTRFLENCNAYLGMSNFPVHVEVRKQADGAIVPIEFNPLRFAGLCVTDLSYFAYGFKTYQYFLESKKPKWDKILEGKEGLTYAMILLTKEGYEGTSAPFDYGTFSNHFENLLALRKTEYSNLGTFGFAFTKTEDKDWDAELTAMLHSSLDEFIKA